jgi:RimJ/RimL family protein N-acetyltransferase
MLRGDRVGLRARQESDVAVLQAELYEDVQGWSRASAKAWRPVSEDGPYQVRDAKEADERDAAFSVVDLASGDLAGTCIVWDIDQHNRRAHLGLNLRPAFRGMGLGTDVVKTLCRYAFDTLGLQRLQVDTLADNAAMINSAKRNGFVHEGTLRRCSWMDGEFTDEVILGLLAAEWRQARAGTDQDGLYPWVKA